MSKNYVKKISVSVRKLIIIKCQVSCIHKFNANPIKIAVILWGGSTQNHFKLRFIWKNKWIRLGKPKEQ